jgi:wyosine [tRNA(Phe)-imidazoG37] synthetase (radical SAM superfamily)
MQVYRQEFYLPETIASQMEFKLKCLSKSDLPDYITLVPDGEPTLDIHLGELIAELKSFGFPVAIISNSSLIDHKDVQNELMNADYISLKLDTVKHSTWKKINKPHREIQLESILKAIHDFSKDFTGKLVTETMLIKDLNDTEEELEELAKYLQSIKPDLAYIAIPTRPTAYINTLHANEKIVTCAYEIFTSHDISAELLTEYEGNAFSTTGNFRDDILSITAVHPMREDAVAELLHKSNGDNNLVNILIKEKLIEKLQYNGYTYYLRKFDFKPERSDHAAMLK